MPTKKNMCNLKVKSYFIWWECLGLHPSSPEKTAARRQKGSQAIYKFATKGAGCLNIKRSGIKLTNLAFCIWEDESLWIIEFIPFICTSAIGGRSCLPVHLKEWQMAAPCIPPALQQSP